jgi:hypothetical protein
VRLLTIFLHFLQEVEVKKGGKRLRNWQRASMSQNTLNAITSGRGSLTSFKSKKVVMLYTVRVSHNIQADVVGKLHVYYTLVVKSNIAKERSWTVDARFKEMHMLAQAIQSTFPIAVALFPKRKGFFGSAMKRLGMRYHNAPLYHTSQHKRIDTNPNTIAIVHLRRSVDADAETRAGKLQQFWNCLMKSISCFKPKTDSSVKWVYGTENHLSDFESSPFVHPDALQSRATDTTSKQ